MSNKILNTANVIMEFRLRRKTTSQGEESPRKKKKDEKFAIGEKIL